MANGKDPTTQDTRGNDHDLLIEINTKLGILLDQFHDHKEKAIAEMSRLDNAKLSKTAADKMMGEFQETNRDHEKRMRRLERYGGIAIGAMLLLQLLLPYIEL